MYECVRQSCQMVIHRRGELTVAGFSSGGRQAQRSLGRDDRKRQERYVEWHVTIIAAFTIVYILTFDTILTVRGITVAVLDYHNRLYPIHYTTLVRNMYVIMRTRSAVQIAAQFVIEDKLRW